MRRRAICGVAVVLWLAGAWAHADTLPIAENLIDMRTAQGEQLLRNSGTLDSYVRLSVNFVTEEDRAFCGVASIVMVLNALGMPAPVIPRHAPFRMFDQQNIFDEQTERALPREVIAEQGMTVDQVGQLLALHAVEAEVRHAGDSSPDEFRALAGQYLNRVDHAVVVNYLRRAINQERGGHISPLGAYEATTDRFLILDVARYKYPPVWVKTAELFAAMNTVDSRNDGKTRGFVLIKAPQLRFAAPE